MGKIAFVFAGQGAQFEGMGKDLYQEYDVIRNIFKRADQIRPGTTEQCLQGSIADLSITVNTQPCMFVLEYAIAKLLEEYGIFAQAVAGFSLGEMVALTESGLFDFEEGLRFTMLRAQAMDAAAKATPGKMAAVLRLSAIEVEEICAHIPDVWAVNYNCPGQTVISGSQKSVDLAITEVVKQEGKAIVLAVSGAFHSPFMTPAYNELISYLNQYPPKQSKLPIYCNLTGQVMDDTSITSQIALQVISPVRWLDTIESMKNAGIEQFIEVGPGKVLSGLIKKINPESKVNHVSDVSSFQQLLLFM